MAHIKKEDIYYTLLKELAGILVQAGEEYVAIFSTYPESFVRLPRMKMFETQADELVRDIMNEEFEAMLNGSQDAKTALDKIVERGNAAIAQANGQ